MKRQHPKFESEIGFEGWGDYMGAKISKLEEQFQADQEASGLKQSNLFEGISIFVNGYTNPTAEELKRIMIQHGGTFHHYKRSHTTYTIATNLPDVKIRQITSEVIISPNWVVDSLEKGRILDYKKYLLYTEHKPSQPKLNFSVLPEEDKPEFNDNISVSPDLFENSDEEKEKPKIEPSSNVTKSAADPAFLSEFFKKSRLHHISTLGAGFKQHVSDLREKSDKKFSDRENLSNLAKTDENQGQQIMHIDMDCFFVSVGLKKFPTLKGIPLAVTHSKGSEAGIRNNRVDRKQEIELYHKRLEDKYDSKNVESKVESRLLNIDNQDSLSEIASCSYEARKLGVKNGMFVGAALKLCPNLKTIPYDFDRYREVAFSLYNTVAKYTLNIEAVSCDEMFVDLSELLEKTNVDCMEFVKFLRNEIKSITECPCSAGVGSNRLLARLATKKAKPDGQYLLNQDIEEYMRNIEISDLPGVGRSTTYRLNQLNLKFCRDLQDVSLFRLQQEFGRKFGENLYQACRGIDEKPLVYEQDRKSVSVEINYGIRFTTNEQAERFLKQLCEEVHNRLLEAKKKGRHISLKLSIRAKEAPVETAKYLGCGVCDYFNKSIALNDHTNDLAVIQKSIIQLFRNFNFPPHELRGIGVHISKLDGKHKEKPQVNVIQDMFKKATERVKNETIVVPVVKNEQQIENNKIKSENNIKNLFQNQKEKKNDTHDLNLDEIDPDFLLALPDDIRNEIIEQHFAKIQKKSLKVEHKTPKKYKTRDKTKTSGKKSLKFVQETPKKVESYDYSELYETKLTKIEEKTPEKVKVEEKSKYSDNIFAQPNWNSVLLAWIESTNSPEECDITIIADNAMKFAEGKQIFNLYPAMRYLFRKINESKQCNWHKAYFKIVNQIQLGMSKAYGSKLSVLTDFNCDNNCAKYLQA